MKSFWMLCLIALCGVRSAAAGCPVPPVAWAPEDSPFYMCVGPSGNVYGSDGSGSTVTVRSPNGAVLATWSGASSGAGSFLPRGLGADAAGNVYLADVENSRIVVLDAAGHYLRSLSNPGTGVGQFLVPDDLALGPADDLFVVDLGGSKVLHMKRDGTFLNEWAVVISNSLYDIAVDADGTVYGSPWPATTPLEVYSSSGALLRTWSPGSADEFVDTARIETARGHVFVSILRIGSGVPVTELRTFDGFGAMQCAVAMPFLGAIAFDPRGNLYVGGLDEHEIYRLEIGTPAVQLSWGALKDRYR